MRPYEELSARGQVGRMRRVARAALARRRDADALAQFADRVELAT